MPAPKAHPSDSLVQRSAERLILRSLNRRNGLLLVSDRVELPTGGSLQLDGIDRQKRVMCEVWAHHGEAKSAQRHKVMSDAFKLCLAARLLGGRWKKLLVVVDAEAAKAFEGTAAWRTAALREFGVKILPVRLSSRTSAGIKAAQLVQRRGMALPSAKHGKSGR
jgi:hypothetical protein